MIESLTYEELAARLGITRQSARQLTARKRWPRHPGNDGMTRVSVPVEVLTRLEARKPTRSDTSVETASEASSEGTSEGTSDAVSIGLMTRLSAAQSELIEMARKLGMAESEISALKREADDARQRTEELRQDRDRWHAEATARRSFWRRLVG